MHYKRETFLTLPPGDLESATFSDCNFPETDARNAKFIDCTFERSAWSSVKIDGAVIQAKFIAAKLEGINLFTAKRTLFSVGFENCLIRYSSFADLKLKETSFAGSTLQQVDFSDADLTGADFSNCSFEDCVFRNTNLSKSDFRGARGYAIDVRFNIVKKAHFDIPEVLGLLAAFDIEIS